jgi:heparan-alpha-glucosaminide N-acetyltransferase
MIPNRIPSVDIFRAVTMLLMIFVNDLWTLHNIPEWLEHTKADEDGMGLADTIFPAFLFIVGLSIPLALDAKQFKGATQLQQLTYILTRSFALLFMGFFHVNLENYSDQAILRKPVWEILITISFFLIWLDYSPKMDNRKRISFRLIGFLLLAIMAAIYKGDEDGRTVWMRPQWWGILGLIGWAYLWSSVVYLFFRRSMILLVAAMIFFFLFNMAAHGGLLASLSKIKEYIWISGDGAMPALTMAGVVTCMVYREGIHREKFARSTVILIAMAIAMSSLGFITRPYWGISKIHATPSWILICSAISIVCFLIFAWIADVKRREAWFKSIRPAGTSTLTCYLLPYLHYSIYSLIGISLPLFLRTGIIGLIKSLLYAWIIILIVGWLERRRIRLKI